MDAASFRVAVIALESRKGDAALDCRFIAAKLAYAARQGVWLALFSPSGIDDSRADPFDDPSIHAIAAAVDESGVAAGVGWIERTEDGGRFDSYAICFPGGARVRHRMPSAARRGSHSGNRLGVFDAHPLAHETERTTERTMPRGSLPLSFAIVGRHRLTG
ncbi:MULTISPECIES: hypothetical protein [Caballeronia]|uniref:hypothetical protein n=1 Tax=Caballeronia TaxID=1827195 RepID=UPI001FD4361F|nr:MULTISPECIES: hypothetical protein [Caballeronia]